jgi:hypothetical protein
MNNWYICWFSRIYERNAQFNKQVKNLVRQRCAEGFDSGVKGLRMNAAIHVLLYSTSWWGHAQILPDSLCPNTMTLCCSSPFGVTLIAFRCNGDQGCSSGEVSLQQEVTYSASRRSYSRGGMGQGPMLRQERADWPRTARWRRLNGSIL